MPDVRDLTPEDAPELTALYGEYEWWDDRDVAGVREALAETEVAVGVECEARTASEASGGEPRADDGELVAAARVLTDYNYYANVFDVIVAADRRGEGLGEVLMNAVCDHPDLQSVPGLSLLCREGLVPFYESVGFEPFDSEFEVPEGGTEELVRMTYAHDDS
ncbi:GNAT family N-acetyltransferase [Halorussus salinisoli]|uniref:GNAT family N-acetyltransferase n=1 Tax=Halorussus salinisoli TaxID=2558242 RepID=UPI0010C1AF0F|nr:GNAT family N-acetyltransferase [Halorussus salinisoli]